MRFSAATALDAVRAGTPLQELARGRSMDDIVAAVRDGKAGLRYGVTALDDAGLRRTAGLDPWSVAQTVGHALAVDEDAHVIARTLSLGRVPGPGALRYDEPGPPDRSREDLLASIDAAEERAMGALVLAGGGPTFLHRDLGELSARAWVLFIAVHDALHLHQAAAIVRTPR